MCSLKCFTFRIHRLMDSSCTYLTLYILPAVKYQNSGFSWHVFMFCIILAINNDICPRQHWFLHFYNGESLLHDVQIEYILFIFIIKDNVMHYFSNLFWWRTPHVSDRSTVHHQQLCWLSGSRQSVYLAWQIPVAVYTVLRLLMMNNRSVQNM